MEGAQEVGYWGYFVVAKTERPATGLVSLGDVRDRLGGFERVPVGWRVWEHPGEPGIDAGPVVVQLAQEIQGPAMIGFVMDSDCVVIEAAGPASGSWTACLGPRLMDGYLSESGHRVEDWFLPPHEAAERLTTWAREAGLASAHPLPPALFRADVDPWAQDKFFDLLEETGLDFPDG